MGLNPRYLRKYFLFYHVFCPHLIWICLAGPAMKYPFEIGNKDKMSPELSRWMRNFLFIQGTIHILRLYILDFFRPTHALTISA